MKLRLSPLIDTILRFSSNEELSQKTFDDAIAIIRKLEKLYHIEKLSDEEIKQIVSQCYDFSLDYYDMIRISKSILKNDEVTIDTIQTSIITNVSGMPDDELSYLEAFVYHPSNKDFDTNHTYTAAELEELIRERQIVLEDFSFSVEDVVLDDNHKPNLDEEDKLRPFAISCINQSNLDSYADIIIPLIRKRLQKPRVQKDITRIINYLRTKLLQLNASLDKQKQELAKISPLELSIASIQFEARMCTAYKNMLDQMRSKTTPHQGR